MAHLQEGALPAWDAEDAGGGGSRLRARPRRWLRRPPSLSVPQVGASDDKQQNAR